MQDRREIIEVFRHLISSRYNAYGWIAGLTWITALFIQIWIDPVSFYRSIISGMQLLGLLLLWYSLNHRYWILYHFNNTYPNPIEKLEAYFDAKQKKWDTFYLIRMGIMASLGLAMILLMVFERKNVWAGIITSVFLSLTLTLMIKEWLDFSDHILLNDIKHNLRDHPSE